MEPRFSLLLVLFSSASKESHDVQVCVWETAIVHWQMILLSEALISGIVSAPRGAAVLGVRDGPFLFPTAFDIRPQSDGVHKTDTLGRDGRPRADKADSSPSSMHYLSLSHIYTHAETKWKDTHQIGSCDRAANVFPCKVKGQSMRPHPLLLMMAHPEHAPGPWTKNKNTCS